LVPCINPNERAGQSRMIVGWHDTRIASTARRTQDEVVQYMGTCPDVGRCLNDNVILNAALIE
jgi:hypothetical protein